MRWGGGRRSENVEDRRGMRTGMPIGRGGMIGGGLGSVVVIVILLLLGVDPSVLLQGGGMPMDQPYEREATNRAPGQLPGQMPGAAPGQAPAGEDQMKDFVSVVLGDTEDTWNAIFSSMGRDYIEPKLVLFSGAVQSACGFAQAAMGPFYCPADMKVYIDLSFYDEMRTRFGAPGDFAQAYVIAHEVGHHVQRLLGITQKVEEIRRRLSPADANALSVRVELQADCFAGVWANHAQKARQILEAGDIEEGLNAAAAIGDDRLQKQAGGRVVPDSFTHGSSAQRVRWFRRGIESGELGQCNTFDADQL